MKGILGKIILVRNYLYSHQLTSIFSLGILLRIIVFIFQGPFNNDNHFYVVEYIRDYHALPHAFLIALSDHPPLYYILASLFFPGGAKIVQVFSLITSIGTLSVIYWLIKNLEFIQPLRIKKYCLLFACTLPQFVMFGNYLSNDSLSFFIGSLIFLQIFLYINKPNRSNQNILALYLGLGLLTKGTFLLFIPSLILLIVLVNMREGIRLKQTALSLLIFIFIFLVLGSYKGIENMIYFGRPIVFNTDTSSWVNSQRPTYIGLKSIYDINVLKLFKYPTISTHTAHSYPLLLYGTFWYQYIFESNFKANTTVFKNLGSYIYTLALLPTLLFLTGFLRILFSIRSAVSRKEPNALLLNNTTYEVISLFLLLSNSLVIIFIGVRYDIWSAFQSRYLFPSLFSIIILFNSGLDYVRRRYSNAEKVVYPLLNCLYFLFILYFIIEIAHRFVGYIK
jgi:4-amino-4-deoxy-L-arabinose transferase-like glycosyltransferase